MSNHENVSTSEHHELRRLQEEHALVAASLLEEQVECSNLQVKLKQERLKAASFQKQLEYERQEHQRALAKLAAAEKLLQLERAERAADEQCEKKRTASAAGHDGRDSEGKRGRRDTAEGAAAAANVSASGMGAAGTASGDRDGCEMPAAATPAPASAPPSARGMHAGVDGTAPIPGEAAGGAQVSLSDGAPLPDYTASDGEPFLDQAGTGPPLTEQEGAGLGASDASGSQAPRSEAPPNQTNTNPAHPSDAPPPPGPAHGSKDFESHDSAHARFLSAMYAKLPAHRAELERDWVVKCNQRSLTGQRPGLWSATYHCGRTTVLSLPKLVAFFAAREEEQGKPADGAQPTPMSGARSVPRRNASTGGASTAAAEAAAGASTSRRASAPASGPAGVPAPDGDTPPGPSGGGPRASPAPRPEDFESHDSARARFLRAAYAKLPAHRAELERDWTVTCYQRPLTGQRPGLWSATYRCGRISIPSLPKLVIYFAERAAKEGSSTGATLPDSPRASGPPHSRASTGHGAAADAETHAGAPTNGQAWAPGPRPAGVPAPVDEPPPAPDAPPPEASPGPRADDIETHDSAHARFVRAMYAKLPAHRAELDRDWTVKCNQRSLSSGLRPGLWSASYRRERDRLSIKSLPKLVEYFNERAPEAAGSEPGAARGNPQSTPRGASGNFAGAGREDASAGRAANGNHTGMPSGTQSRAGTGAAGGEQSTGGGPAGSQPSSGARAKVNESLGDAHARFLATMYAKLPAYRDELERDWTIKCKQRSMTGQRPGLWTASYHCGSTCIHSLSALRTYFADREAAAAAPAAAPASTSPAHAAQPSGPADSGPASIAASDGNSPSDGNSSSAQSSAPSADAAPSKRRAEEGLRGDPSTSQRVTRSNGPPIPPGTRVPLSVEETISRLKATEHGLKTERSETGCNLCNSSLYAESGFSDRTILLCDMCNREFHVGCLRAAGAGDLTAEPTVDWYCCDECREIADVLRVRHNLPHPLTPRGAPDHCIQVVHPKLLKPEDPHHATMAEVRRILEREFKHITDDDTGKSIVTQACQGKLWGGHDFSTLCCVLLRYKWEPIAALVMRVSPLMLEIPLIATRPEHRRQRHASVLLDGLSDLLHPYHVRQIVLPASTNKIKERIWTHGFGFAHMDREETYVACEYMDMVQFNDTRPLKRAIGPPTHRVYEPRPPADDPSEGNSGCQLGAHVQSRRKNPKRKSQRARG